MKKQIQKLAVIMGLGSLTGAVSLAALKGLFRPENAFSIAILFIVGPATILSAVLLEGTVRERMLAALLAGVISTVLIVAAAGIGPELLAFLNLSVLKIIGGIAVLTIGLLIMDISIPEKTPTTIMLVGIILSLLLR
tara:strand:- start:171 stop:581 length:411 start_codon:yes stop_codon:yes gene_type:complete